MPLAGLMGAAGAYEGLKDLLARRFEQEKFAEAQRQARAREGLQERELQETAGLRKATLQATEAERLRDEAYRRDALAQGRELSMAQLAQARAIADANRESLNERATAGRENQLLMRFLMGAQQQPPRYRFLQTPEGYVLGDPYSGQTSPVQAPGGGPLMPRPTAQERDEGRSFEDVENLLRTIRDNYEPGFTGPIQGRFAPLAQAVGRSNPKYARFRQAMTALQNTITRLNFSSRASDQDVLRAIGESPQATMPDADFRTQLAQTILRVKERKQAYGASVLGQQP